MIVFNGAFKVHHPKLPIQTSSKSVLKRRSLLLLRESTVECVPLSPPSVWGMGASFICCKNGNSRPVTERVILFSYLLPNHTNCLSLEI